MMKILKVSWVMASRALRALGGDRPVRRAVSLLLIYVMVLQPVVSLRLAAETSGATAPEVTKFEPVDTTDLVNMVSGDFTYNIPILNVPGPEGGYPLSLNYHNNVRHGEEASWVGLGWNLQPGSIARGVRGYPDDFNDIGISRRHWTNKYETYGVGFGFAYGAADFSIGVNYTTYKGFGGYVSASVGIKGTPASVGVTLSYSPDGEWGVSAGVSYTVAPGMQLGVNVSSSGVVGVQASQKAGGVSSSLGIDSKGRTTAGVSGSIGKGTSAMNVGMNLTADSHGVSVGFSASTKQGITLRAESPGVVGIGMSDARSASFSSYSGGGVYQESFAIGFIITVSYSAYWVDKTEDESAYGYFYHHLAGDQGASRVNEWSPESDPNQVGGDSKEHALARGLNYLPSYDGYQVTGQGTGGNIRPTRRVDWVFRPKRLEDQWWEASAWPWDPGKDGDAARFVFDGDNSERIPSGDYLGRTGTERKSGGYLTTSADASPSQTAQLYAALSPALSSPLLALDGPSLADGMSPQAIRAQQFQTSATDTPVFLGKTLGVGSRRVVPHFDQDKSTPWYSTPDSGHSKFQSFEVTEADGKRYLFGEPVMQWWSRNVSANTPEIVNEFVANDVTINSPYAYAWYLTELTYPDYYDMAGNGLSDDDKGGWVKFSYVTGVNDYHWHTSPDGQLNDGPINRVDQVGSKKAGLMYSMEYGVKTIKYPQIIETSTHKAIFVTSPRLDGREVINGGGTRSRNIKLIDNGNGNYDLVVNSSVSNLPPGRGTDGEDLLLPGLATNAISSWDIISDNGLLIDGGTCGTNAWEAHTVSQANFSPASQAMVNINGVPLLLKSMTRQIDETTSTDQVSPADCNGSPSYRTYVSGNTTICRATVVVQQDKTVANNQFWAQPVSIPNKSSISIFSNIWSKWNAMLAIAAGNGGQINLDSATMQRLDDIYLIEKASGLLVKQVHFYYSYELCPGTPNSVDRLENGVSLNPTRGKLTLKSVQSFGMEGMPANSTDNVKYGLPPWQFDYDIKLNKAYGGDAKTGKQRFDRWGFHKSDGGRWNHRDSNPDDQAAWSLTRITLPTGGSLRVEYEPKDYARVQDRFPIVPSSNNREVGNYKINLAKWKSDMGITAWPKTPAEWAAFKGKADATPMVLFDVAGTSAQNTTAGVPTADTRLDVTKPHPVASAPNPTDLATYLGQTSQVFRDRVTNAQVKLGPMATDAALPQVNKRLTEVPTAAMNSTASTDYSQMAMVQLVFERWTTQQAISRANRRLRKAHKYLEPGDVSDMAEDDRTDSQTYSVVAMLTNDVATTTTPAQTRLMVVDPEFEWPTQEPDELYVTWTTNATPKIGGGSRVKRIISDDGRRAYSTYYTYSDLVNNVWTSSGVAANEPMPFAFSAFDDRVIQTERNGWANEVGGGIYHSRVTVRHSWQDSATPAGTAGTVTPLGESVFRFITPADLPHRQRTVEHIEVKQGDPSFKSNGVRLTEVFNVGSWWGKPLWKEDRDSNGRVLARQEHTYKQLAGYLQCFPKNNGAAMGMDQDWEAANGMRQNMSFAWADPRLPKVVDKEKDPAQVNAKFGQEFPATVQESRYLNASVGITAWQAYNTGAAFYRTGGFASTINVVRELNLPPVASETRSYGDNLNSSGTKSAPIKVELMDLWDARTGLALETWTKGRQKTGGADRWVLAKDDPSGLWRGGHWEYDGEWLVSRTWPAYWAYSGMAAKNQLTQTVQTTTLRAIGLTDTAPVYLNSKVTLWWQPDTPLWDRWLAGGEFVWNGRGGKPLLFQDFAWNPKNAKDGLGVDQVTTAGTKFKDSGWLFTGSVTGFDTYSHALEAVDGDGVFGCSKYGYPYTTTGMLGLSSGILPVAKFSNARDNETQYFNFEKAWSASDTASDDPLVRLRFAYSGNSAQQGNFTITLPPGPVHGDGNFEVRYFIQAAPIQAVTQNQKDTAFGSLPAGTTLAQLVPCEAVPDTGKQWWMVRLKVPAGLGSTTISNPGLIDDLSVFPWRKNGVPASVSHFAYDMVLGQVTSITGSNGRTMRYKYDRLGRLMAVYDAYGKPMSATRYKHVVNP